MTALTDRRMPRLLIGAVLFFGLMATLAVLWHNWGDLLLPQEEDQRPAAPVRAETLAHGEYLARAGNCVGCHTRLGGAPLAGGRAIDTPFGPVYSSNLTPDPGHGLGQWTAQDFWQAMHRGRSRGARLLTPAFPYQHFQLLSRSDSDALWAYLQQQPAVAEAVPAPGLRWPLGTQPALAVWRTLFFEAAAPSAEPGRSPEWQRGADLVRGLGHCAACHGPRNALGAIDGIDDLRGGLMPGLGYYAPNLLNEETGWAQTPPQDLMRLLQTGHSPQASTSGPMAEVVKDSLQYLSEADLRAMVNYLQSRALEASPTAPRAPAPQAQPAVAERGRWVYEQQCRDCHGAEGQGQTGRYPALAGNRAVQLAEPANLVQSVLYGGYGPATAGHPRPYGMPPFILNLDDRDLAAVLTHIRQSWGGQASEVTPLQVARLRNQASAR